MNKNIKLAVLACSLKLTALMLAHAEPWPNLASALAQGQKIAAATNYTTSCRMEGQTVYGYVHNRGNENLSIDGSVEFRLYRTPDSMTQAGLQTFTTDHVAPGENKLVTQLSNPFLGWEFCAFDISKAVK